MGFGWEDTNVYRIGADYRYDNNWTFRAGFAYNDQTIPADQVLFNILAPAVIRKHATLGFTYQSGCQQRMELCLHACIRVKRPDSGVSVQHTGCCGCAGRNLDVPELGRYQLFAEVLIAASRCLQQRPSSGMAFFSACYCVADDGSQPVRLRARER